MARGKRNFFAFCLFSGSFHRIYPVDLHKKDPIALLSRKDTAGNAFMRSAKRAMPSGRNGQVRFLQFFGERLQKRFSPSYQKPSPAGEGFLCFLKGRMQCRGQTPRNTKPVGHVYEPSSPLSTISYSFPFSIVILLASSKDGYWLPSSP